MTQTLTPEAIQQRASQARFLLENPLLKEAFESLQSRYMDAWKQTASSSVDERERLFAAFQVLEQVETHLQAMIENGKVADYDINRLKGQGKLRSAL